MIGKQETFTPRTGIVAPGAKWFGQMLILLWIFMHLKPRRQLPRPGKFNFSLIVVILLLNGILNRAGSSVKSSFYFL